MNDFAKDPQLGRHPIVELEWIGRAPNRRALARLNSMVVRLDYDAPMLTECGVVDVWGIDQS